MGRLFWKIFFWYWVALVLLNVGIGWGVRIYYDQVQEIDDRVLEEKVQTIADAFEAGRVPDAIALLKKARRDSSTQIFVINERGEDFFNRPLPAFILRSIRGGETGRHRVHEVDAVLPGGQQIQLLALYSPTWLRSFRNTPLWIIFSITLVISTLVCYWLAKYLSSPVQRLSSATRQLAEGDFNVRVGNISRKDEIADLAVDFDRMADKIQKLLSSQKQLLQDISHELRSPLARLQVALALVRRKNTEQTTDYDRIAKDLNRLEDLIGEVLTLSRLDTVTYTREPVDLSELINGIVEDCQLEAAAKSCSIKCDCAPDLALEGSPELLRRAIENVLRNAAKFSFPETSIHFEAAKRGQNIVITICDQGPGIPDNSEDSMFEAFVRIDPARTHKPGGYGLGLAIAKKAIELHGGSIKAANRPEGGLAVTITLPA